MTVATSPVPGMVAMRYVDDGARVEAGENICAVECMKTLYQVCAPTSGIVRHAVGLGEVIGEGDVVAEFMTA